VLDVGGGEIVTFASPGGGEHGSPAWSESEEDEGATSSSANMDTKLIRLPEHEEAQA
jgi:hypothetical protein